MTTDSRPPIRKIPEGRGAVGKPPMNEAIYSEASAAEEVEGGCKKENERQGNTEAEGQELEAERLAESQDSVT